APSLPYPLYLHDALPISAIVLERNRRAVGFERFHSGLGRAIEFPKLLAARRIEREQIRLVRPVRATAAEHRHIPLQDLHKKFARSEEHTSELQSRSDLVC